MKARDLSIELAEYSLMRTADCVIVPVSSPLLDQVYQALKDRLAMCEKTHTRYRQFYKY